MLKPHLILKINSRSFVQITPSLLYLFTHQRQHMKVKMESTCPCKLLYILGFPMRERILVVLVNSQMYQSWCHEILVTAPEMRERILVVLVNSQMCQSWYHEILVTAPEMKERSLSFNSLLLNWPMLEICNVLCTSHCVVFMMFPSHRTGPWEGALNQQGK